MIPKKQIDIGTTGMAIGLLFAFIETLYFGSTFLPTSKAELICDALSAMITGAGMGIYVTGIINHIDNFLK